MASALTEIIRILQLRFTGAVYKSSGRAAVWIRFIGLILFITIFYILYSLVVQGFSSFLTVVSQIQTTGLFVPFVWVALALFYVLKGVFLNGFLFIALSAVFIAGLYYLAVGLNMRFGLYEPPAITVQKSGVYAPKTGILGRIGFSSVEAAIIRKDLRAFTRRRELIQIFIFPIAIIVLFLVQSLGVRDTGGLGLFYTVFIFLFPSGAMAMTLGNTLIGEEGQAVWRIYASPISAKNLVKSKFFFLIFLTTLILLMTGTIGIVFYHPSIQATIAIFLEGFFIIPAVGSVALLIGFKGADFSATRRARMIRQEWALISLIVCAVTGIAVLSPLIPYALSLFASSFLAISPLGPFEIAISVVISGVISMVISLIIYRFNIRSAKELLRKAEI
jgi:hypothetical protein